ncbi:MAG: hypothetical protein HXY51_12795 [Nitrospirae bacterium]|nr:hypothetical protein [Nitrospirota bacterium]
MIMMMSGIVRGEAVAAEWSAEPSLSVRGVYNSNLLLTNGNNEVWGNWVSPNMKFKGATESLQIDGTARGEFVQYYGSTDRGLTNLYFPVRASYRWDRFTFGFEGGFTRDNTLMSELQQTGLVLNFTQRNLWTATPSLTIGLTERLRLQLDYRFSDASYQNGLSLGLVNYQINGGSSKLSYNLRDRTQVQITGDLVNFVAPDIDQTWTYYGAGAGLSHNLSQSIIATVSGGVRFINSNQGLSSGSLSQNDVVWLYHASIRKEFERSAISLDGSREINPSGFGRLFQTDRVSGAISHNLTENLTASLTGALNFVSVIATVGDQSFPDSRYNSVSPNLSWRFAQWWALDVNYTYAERIVDNANQWNFANSTFVMLTYGGPKWSVSR